MAQLMGTDGKVEQIIYLGLRTVLFVSLFLTTMYAIILDFQLKING